MNVPFHIRRNPRNEPASAVLFAGPDPARRLFGLCAALGLDPDGRVFGVAGASVGNGDRHLEDSEPVPVSDQDRSGGLLLLLRAPTHEPLPGGTRLRAVAPNVLLPVDGVLVPTLLDDEAQGLGRDRGLLFLPGGRVLAFDPKQPVPLSTLLTAPARPRSDWEPLPDRPALADRIESILIDYPDETPETALDIGTGGEIGIDADDPNETNSGASGIARAWKKAKALFTGDSQKNRNSTDPPVPDAQTIRRQDAALRALIRQFRAGEIEKALRRALPVGDSGESRGAGVAGGSRLPDRPFFYRLRDLLGGMGKDGPPSAWIAGNDVMADLTLEYRKAAEEATRRGDHRRAAAIYGKLLRDDRAAARALLDGGLYHDAAVLLLARLNDRPGAARAFASAGEIDRAIELYREIGDHEAAGDLLRTLGEEDAAVSEYIIAAERMTVAGSSLTAGNLLLEKAGRIDLAMRHYAIGWKHRPGVNAVPCALKAARVLAEGGNVDAFRVIVDEADAHFSTFSGMAEAGQFYNGVAALTSLAGLEPAREELRDRALMGLAAQIRNRAQPGERAHTLVPSLLGGNGHWSAAVVSDAAHAVAAATGSRTSGVTRPKPARSSSRLLCEGTVSAVAGASETGDLFVGTASGDVWAFRPETSEVLSIASHDLPVASLATDPSGNHLVVLRCHESGRGVISSYARQPNGRYSFLNFTSLESVSSPWLTPVLGDGARKVVGIWDGESFYVLSTDTLSSLSTYPLPPDDIPPFAGFLEVSVRDEGEFRLWTHAAREWVQIDLLDGEVHQTKVRWHPGERVNSLRFVPLSVFAPPGGPPEIAGLGDGGALHWAKLPLAQLTLSPPVGTDSLTFLAVAIIRAGLVAAVSQDRVDWLRCGVPRFLPWRTTTVSTPTAVAAFASRPTSELLILCGEGTLVRVPIPE